MEIKKVTKALASEAGAGASVCGFGTMFFAESFCAYLHDLFYPYAQHNPNMPGLAVSSLIVSFVGLVMWQDGVYKQKAKEFMDQEALISTKAEEEGPAQAETADAPKDTPSKPQP
jgi:hypothetical protein